MVMVHPEPTGATLPPLVDESPKFSPFLRLCKARPDAKLRVTAICTPPLPAKGGSEGATPPLMFAHGYQDGEVRVTELPHAASPLSAGAVVVDQQLNNVRVCGLAFHPGHPHILFAGMSSGKVYAAVLRDGRWSAESVFVGGSSDSGRQLVRQDTVMSQKEGLALGFSSDGGHLAVAHGGKVYLVRTGGVGRPDWSVRNLQWDTFLELGSNSNPESLVVQPGRPAREVQVACTEGKSIRVWAGILRGEGDKPDKGLAPTELAGHTRVIHCLAYSPGTGDLLASASEDTTIRIWEASSLKTLDILRGHKGRVETIEFQSPELLASGSVDYTIRLWEVKRGECICILKANDQVHRLACWLQDPTGITGDLVLSGTYTGELAMWETSSGKNDYLLPSNQRKNVQQMAMAGSHLAASFADGKLLAWDLHDAEGEAQELPGTQEEVLYAVTMSPDGKRIASGGGGRRIAVRQLSPSGGWELTMALMHKPGDASKAMTDIYGMAFSPTGRYLASVGEDRWLRLWDLEALADTPEDERRPVAMIYHAPETRRIHTVAFHPDLTEGTCRLVTGTWDGLVRMFEVGGLGDPATAGGEGSTRELDDKSPVWDGRGHTRLAHCVAFSRRPAASGGPRGDGDLLVASASFDNTIRIWDARDGDCLAVLQMEGHSSGVKSCVWSPDGRYLASCHFDGLVLLWPISARETAKAVPRHGFHGGMGSATTWVAWESIKGRGEQRSVVFAYSTERGEVCLVDTSFVDQDFLPYSHASRFVDTENEDIISVFERLAKQHPTTLAASGRGDGTLLHQLIKQDFPITLGKMLTVATDGGRKLVTTRTTDFRLEHLREPIRADPLRAARDSKPCAEAIVEALLEQNAPKAFSTDSGADAITDLAVHFPDLATKVLNRIGVVSDDNHQAVLIRAEGKGRRRQAAIAEDEILCEGSDQMLVEGVWNLTKGGKGYWDPDDERTDPVDVAAGYVAFPYAAGLAPDQEITDTFLHRVVKKGDPRVLNTLVGRAILQFKWESFGQRKFFFKLAVYAVHVLLVSAQALVVGQSTIARDDYLRIISVLILVSTALQAYREGYQMLSLEGGAAAYLTDGWNYLDIGVVLSSLITGVQGLLDWDDRLFAMSALACFLNWNKVLFFMRAFKGTGALVRMVVEITWDIKFLVMLVVVVNISASLSLFVLKKDAGFWHTALEVYAMMLGDFDLGEMGEENQHFPLLAKFVFVSFTLLQTILLLNLLIALMGDSYERVQEKAISYTLLERATIITEIEVSLTRKELGVAEHFPKWLHVLMPRSQLHSMKGGSGDGVDEDDSEWTGVAGSVKRVVGKIVDSNTKKLNNKIDTKMDRLQEDVRRLSEVVDRMNDAQQRPTREAVMTNARQLSSEDRAKLVQELQKSLPSAR